MCSAQSGIERSRPDGNAGIALLAQLEEGSLQSSLPARSLAQHQESAHSICFGSGLHRGGNLRTISQHSKWNGSQFVHVRAAVY